RDRAVALAALRLGAGGRQHRRQQQACRPGPPVPDCSLHRSILTARQRKWCHKGVPRIPHVVPERPEQRRCLRGGEAVATAKIAAFPAQRVVVTGQTPSAPAPMTYRDAGVDIDAGNELVERIKPLVKRSFRPEVMGGLGGFGALFDLSGEYREPVLVWGADGGG